MGNLLIVVIYTEDILACTTVTSLLKVDSTYLRDIAIYFYVNGKKDFRDELRKMFSNRCKYLHTFYDGKNRGIVYAYKKAIMEEGKNFEWITFLDQDSVFDEKFVKTVIRLDEYPLDHSTMAVAPVVKTQGHIPMSPLFKMRVRRLNALGVDTKDGIPISPSRIFCGMAKTYVSGLGYPTCINSMTTFRSGFLLEMAPSFPVDFFMDGFDNWLFYRIHKMDLKFYILEDVIVHHHISVANPKITDTYWAREFMSLINTSRISFTFFPLAALRFIWRLFRVIWQTKDIRHLNLMRIYSKYRLLKKDL
ncbi:MAG: glycosyltransferase [Deltaproteobacteria bacterium]|nr:glycosyltransferase [Deltaproteobacteria bacterium]